jgi:hypothetical protein
MVKFTRRFYWVALVTVYWFCALWLLFFVSPISVDGGGPTPTFYWGFHRPAPTLEEYHRSILTRLLFLYPYWVGASIITSLGCGLTTWIVRLWSPRRPPLFLLSSAATLLSLLLVGAVSDLGNAVHLWRGPAMYGGIEYTLPFLEEMVPMSLLAGVLALARDRLKT